MYAEPDEPPLESSPGTPIMTLPFIIASIDMPNYHWMQGLGC